MWIRSAGSAAAFGIDAVKTPFLNEHLASFCMLLFSLPLLGIVIYNIKDTSGPSVESDEDVRVAARVFSRPAKPLKLGIF
jgi:hypothetical protein